jgi:hypothetical protein
MNLLRILPDPKGSSRSGPWRGIFMVAGCTYCIKTKHILGSQGGQQGNLNLLFIELKVIINMSATVTHNYAIVFYIICAITVCSCVL